MARNWAKNWLEQCFLSTHQCWWSDLSSQFWSSVFQWERVWFNQSPPRRKQVREKTPTDDKKLFINLLQKVWARDKRNFEFYKSAWLQKYLLSSFLWWISNNNIWYDSHSRLVNRMGKKLWKNIILGPPVLLQKTFKEIDSGYKISLVLTSFPEIDSVNWFVKHRPNHGRCGADWEIRPSPALFSVSNETLMPHAQSFKAHFSSKSTHGCLDGEYYVEICNRLGCSAPIDFRIGDSYSPCAALGILDEKFTLFDFPHIDKLRFVGETDENCSEIHMLYNPPQNSVYSRKPESTPKNIRKDPKGFEVIIMFLAWEFILILKV